MQENIESLVGAETSLWAISTDDPTKLLELRDTEGLTFPVLLDPAANTIKAYGLYNVDSDRGIPHPTALIIDKNGLVRYVRTDEDYRERPSIEELRDALKMLAGGWESWRWSGRLISSSVLGNFLNGTRLVS